MGRLLILEPQAAEEEGLMPRARRGLRAVTAPAASTLVRAAIYTRKSTDEGLGRDFSSLDNQRERAEAYARSQDWSVLSTRYDDGGFSGGTTERPALKQLLADVDAGLVDAIILYRLDRFSRSLADFVNLHRFLEERGVALVSVTESINTSTSHGRMIVNVLVSFGQYERELASDRTKHKIEGARHRGKWVGGFVPLGYDLAPEGRRLVINKLEATQVREIFQLFFEKRSLVVVAEELSRRGWTLKRWTTKDGKVFGGGTFDKNSLRRLLTSHTYIGKVSFHGTVYDGEHDGIVSTKVFREVQRVLAENRRDGGAIARNKHAALLRGLLRCAGCDSAMAFAPTKNGNRVFRYYRCSRAMKRGGTSCPTRSINADRVEQFVVDQIRRIGADPQLQEETFKAAVGQLQAQRRGAKAEVKRVECELRDAQHEVDRLVTAVANADGSAQEALASGLAKTQEQVRTMECRLREVRLEEAQLATQTVDEADVAKALAAFDPIWDVLLTPERERLLRLIVDRVDYAGDTQQLQIHWRMAGFGELAAEVGP